MSNKASCKTEIINIKTNPHSPPAIAKTKTPSSQRKCNSEEISELCRLRAKLVALEAEFKRLNDSPQQQTIHQDQHEQKVHNGQLNVHHDQEQLHREQQLHEYRRQQQLESDRRSVHVGNVDLGASAEELEAHFAASCGAICRLSIICNRYTFLSRRGFAYIEFVEEASAVAALCLNDSQFRGKTIRVAPKRRPNYHHHQVPGYEFAAGPVAGIGAGANRRFLGGHRYQPY